MEEKDAISNRLDELVYRDDSDRLKNEIGMVYDAIEQGQQTYEIMGVHVNVRDYLEKLRFWLEQVEPSVVFGASTNPNCFYGRKSDPDKIVALVPVPNPFILRRSKA